MGVKRYTKGRYAPRTPPVRHSGQTINTGVDIDLRELEAFRENVRALVTKHQDRKKIFDQTVEAMTMEFLPILIEQTPVGQPPNVHSVPSHIYEKYWADYIGGNLRDSWQVLGDGQTPRTDRGRFAKRGDVSSVTYSAGKYSLTIVNGAPYAYDVNYGHTQEIGEYIPELGKKARKAWVEGSFFVEAALTLAQQTVAEIAKEVTTDLLAAYLFQGKWVESRKRGRKK